MVTKIFATDVAAYMNEFITENFGKYFLYFQSILSCLLKGALEVEHKITHES